MLNNDNTYRKFNFCVDAYKFGLFSFETTFSLKIFTRNEFLIID